MRIIRETTYDFAKAEDCKRHILINIDLFDRFTTLFVKGRYAVSWKSY